MKFPVVVRRELALVILSLITLQAAAQASRSNWSATPESGDWNLATNWLPAEVPDTPSEQAIFGLTSISDLSLSAETLVGEIIFNAGASTYTITVPETISLSLAGKGISNRASSLQTFLLNGGTLTFGKKASAGANSSYIANGSDPGQLAGAIEFNGVASAGSSSFTANNGLGDGGLIRFHDKTNAGQANFTLTGAAMQQAQPGITQFLGNSSASGANFTVFGGTAMKAHGGAVEFYEQSTAANAIFTANGGTAYMSYGGRVEFYGNSSAGQASFTNTGPEGSTAIGTTDFFQHSAAAHATLNLSFIGAARFFDNSSAAFATVNAFQQGLVLFYDSSTAGYANVTIFGRRTGETISGFGQFFDNSNAGNATFTLTPGSPGDFAGGNMLFTDASSAGKATFILQGGNGGAPGGFIIFLASASGGEARFEILGNSSVDISPIGDDGSGITSFTTGSIEGEGNFYLGSFNLTVGSNNLSTTFSGSLRDGGEFGGSNASVTKIGSGSLLLTGINTYTGETNIQEGLLGGTSLINGALSVGAGTGAAAIVSPGSDSVNPATLTVNGALTFHSNAIYECELSANPLVSDSITAAGVTIDAGAVFNLTLLGEGSLMLGASFTIIHNTSNAEIAGAFSNMPEGSEIVLGEDRLQASYHGGAGGHDLVLTVVE